MHGVGYLSDPSLINGQKGSLYMMTIEILHNFTKAMVSYVAT